MTTKDDNIYVKCNECTEFITINRTKTTGKCLRDSMYKDPETGQCQFGRIKNTQK